MPLAPTTIPSRIAPQGRHPHIKELLVNELAPLSKSDEAALMAWDRRIAAEMFWLSVCSLLCLAGLLHLHDKPEYQPVMIVCALGFLGIYPACWVDAIWGGRHGSRQGRARWLSCLLPPLRLGARDHATGRNVWLPGLGWQPVGRDLEQRLDRVSSVPMIVMALMVLPLIVVEYLWKERIDADPLLSGLLNGAGGLIWFAFAGEFILRFSISHSKWGYVKSHFIDLAIVLLPLFSFLQALRLGRLLRLQQLTRTARLYRLRGVMLRAWRALLLIDAVSRLINGPAEKRLVKLKAALVQKELELADLRAEIAKLEAATAAPTDSSAPATADESVIRNEGSADQAA